MGSVVFRRIHGHIVPIRIKDRDAVATGLGTAAAGVAIAGTAGAAAARYTHTAANVENASRIAAKAARFGLKRATEIGPLFVDPARGTFLTASRNVFRSAIESKRLFKTAGRIQGIGQGIGASLIGYGVNRVLEGTTLKEDKKTRAAVGVAAGVASLFAFKSAFLRGVGNRGFDVLRKATKHVAMKGL